MIFSKKSSSTLTLNRVIKPEGRTKMVPSSKLKVGDIIELHPKQRIPADLILLYSS